MSKEKTPVDFNNPESVAEGLAEAAAQATETATATTGTAKVKKPKIIHVPVSFTAEQDIAAGSVVAFNFDYELPVGTGTRGELNGVALADMTDEQLKIEYRNAHSVWYKQNKTGKDTAKSKARLDAVKAKMDEKGIAPSGKGSAEELDAAGIAKLVAAGKIDAAALIALLATVQAGAPVNATEVPTDATPAV